MRVLVLGGGGREHALCWSISRSPLLKHLWCAPGNAGISEIADCIDIPPTNAEQVVDFCRREAVDLLVIGPEAPLASGVSDAARAAGIAVFGPSRAAAMLEVSKAFAKEIALVSGAPTATYAAFDMPGNAKAHLTETGAPVVVKADGLAAGKGVIIAESVQEGLAAIDRIFDGPGGEAVVLEEKLTGEEASFFVLTDGEAVLPLAGAQDHKRAHDGDVGPNTGGMGAYSPAPVFTPQIEREVMDRIVLPVLNEMKVRGMPYSGVLYVGLMLTEDGPKLIEFNARFGDPECQCILPRLETDLLPLLLACAEGRLEGDPLAWKPDTCLTVVMAAQGYPGSYERGDAIGGLEEAAADPAVTIFHAGTKSQDGGVVSDGGRVLSITALGRDVTEARALAYDAASAIRWDSGFYRSDIGWRAI